MLKSHAAIYCHLLIDDYVANYHLIRFYPEIKET